MTTAPSPHRKSPFSRILLATDCAEASTVALRQADLIARACHAALAVVSVVPMTVPSEALGTSGDDLRSEHDAVGRRALELEAWVLANTGRERHAYAAFVEVGLPDETILARIDKYDADLVILAPSQKSFAERLVLGSVAQAVVRRAPCAVMLVRTFDEKGPIVVATDLQDTHELALSVGGGLAAALGRRVELVHAIDVGTSDAAVVATAIFTGVVPGGLDAGALDGMKESSRGALEASLTTAGFTGGAHVEVGTASLAVIERAHSLEATTLVMGTHGRRGPLRWVLGSVAETIAKTWDGNALIARTPIATP